MKKVELKMVKAEELNNESLAKIAAQAFIPTCSFTKGQAVGNRFVPIQYVLFFRVGNGRTGDESEADFETENRRLVEKSIGGSEGGKSAETETTIPKRRGRPPKSKSEG